MKGKFERRTIGTAKRSRNEQLRKGESFFEVSWKNWQLQASKTSWSNETQFQRQVVLLCSVRSGVSGRHRGDSSEFSGRPLSAVMRDWRPLTRNWRFRFGEEDFSSTSTSLSSGDSPEHRCGLSWHHVCVMIKCFVFGPSPSDTALHLLIVFLPRHACLFR